MSSALLQQTPGALFTLKIADTNNHDVAGHADYTVIVYWVAFTEINGSTPNLSFAIYNGTTTTYLRNAKAMAAKETVTWDEPITLPKGSFLRVLSSAANQIDVVGSASPPK